MSALHSPGSARAARVASRGGQIFKVRPSINSCRRLAPPAGRMDGWNSAGRPHKQLHNRPRRLNHRLGRAGGRPRAQSSGLGHSMNLESGVRRPGEPSRWRPASSAKSATTFTCRLSRAAEQAAKQARPSKRPSKRPRKWPRERASERHSRRPSEGIFVANLIDCPRAT